MNKKSSRELPKSKKNLSRVKRRRRKRKLKTVILLLLLVLIASGAAYFFHIKSNIDKTYSGSNMNKSRDVNSILKKGRPISILLLGTDTGDLDRTDKGRTDSIMVLTLNPKTKTTTVVSIPRDTMISIKGYENTFPQKLNAAYTFGSSETAIKTVEEYLNVPIDFYALVNMDSFKKLIDQVGGVDITPRISFDYEGASFTEGEEQHMDGFTALKYSRMRYDDPEGDYGRTARQRQVIEALLKKSGKISSVLNEPFMNTISSGVKTDLTFSDMLTLATKYKSASEHFKTEKVHGVSENRGGVSYEVIPEEEKQRITDLLRKSLNLSKAKTGPLYGSNVVSSNYTPETSQNDYDYYSNSTTSYSDDNNYNNQFSSSNNTTNYGPQNGSLDVIDYDYNSY